MKNFRNKLSSALENPQIAIAAALVWVITFIIFYNNDNYTIAIGNQIYLKNVPYRVYCSFVYRRDVEYPEFWINHTTITYLKVFPEWIMRVMWYGLYIVPFWYISVSSKSKNRLIKAD